MDDKDKKIRFLIINSYLSTKKKKELLKYFNNLIEENKNYKERGEKNDFC